MKIIYVHNQFENHMQISYACYKSCGLVLRQTKDISFVEQISHGFPGIIETKRTCPVIQYYHGLCSRANAIKPKNIV